MKEANIYRTKLDPSLPSEFQFIEINIARCDLEVLIIFTGRGGAKAPFCRVGRDILGYFIDLGGYFESNDATNI